jgi:NAD(P)-dependent dehydrogenase (short-subunit alcohol dehydrogenase family)
MKWPPPLFGQATFTQTEEIMATVFITGSNRGIGLELTRVFAGRGDTVYAACRSTSDELTATGATVLEGIDVTDADLGDKLGRALAGKSIDIAVLNAGVLRADNLSSLDFDGFRQQLEVNTLGPLRTAAAIRPMLVKGSRVGIITSRMGSIADNGSGGMYGYRASKAAVNAVGKSLANDLRPEGIAVQLLHPGFVRTDMTGGNGHINPDESARTLVQRIDELTLETSGTFRHQNGEELPW